MGLRDNVPTLVIAFAKTLHPIPEVVDVLCVDVVIRLLNTSLASFCVNCNTTNTNLELIPLLSHGTTDRMDVMRILRY